MDEDSSSPISRGSVELLGLSKTISASDGTMSASGGMSPLSDGPALGQNSTSAEQVSSANGQPNPLDVFRMAMTSFFSSSLMPNMNSNNMGCVDPNDLTLSKYVQGIKDSERRRLIQMWVSRGTPEIAAQRNAELYVQRVYENGPHSVYLYLAAVRAMKTDLAANGSVFDSSIQQGALDLYSWVASLSTSPSSGSAVGGGAMAGSLGGVYYQHQNMPSTENVPSWHQAYLASASITPYQLSTQTPSIHNNDQLPQTTRSGVSAASSAYASNRNAWKKKPPFVHNDQHHSRSHLSSSSLLLPRDASSVSPTAPISFVKSSSSMVTASDSTTVVATAATDSAVASYMLENRSSLNDIRVESSSPATRILAQRWIKNTFTSLEAQKPSEISSLDEWRKRLVCFLGLVTEGQSRQSEEGAAMRWLTLPMPKPELVIEVSNSVDRFRDSLPGYHEIAPTPHNDPLKDSSSDGIGTSFSSSAAWSSSGTHHHGSNDNLIHLNKSKRSKNLWIPPQRLTQSQGVVDHTRTTTANESLNSTALYGGGLPSYTSNSSLKRPKPPSSYASDREEKEVEEFIPISEALSESLSSGTRSGATARKSVHLPSHCHLTTTPGKIGTNRKSNSKKSSGLINPLLLNVYSNGGGSALEAASISATALEEISNVLQSAVPQRSAKKSRVDKEEKNKRDLRAKRFHQQTTGHHHGLAAAEFAYQSQYNHNLLTTADTLSGNNLSWSSSSSFYVISTSPTPSFPSDFVQSTPTKIIGLSRAFEKKYLRLCGAPDPALVRSEDILVEAFFFIMNKFIAGVEQSDSEFEGRIAHSNNDKDELRNSNLNNQYHYVEEQLRSIRQDFVVQGIRSPFLYFIYSINSRISQIFHDLGQFNQCHSQLKQLERVFLPDDSSNSNALGKESMLGESLVYRLLYAAVNNLDAEFHKLEQSCHKLLESDVYYYAIEYVLDLRRAIIEQNFCRFMRLSCPEQADQPRQTLYQIRRDELRVVRTALEQFKQRWEGHFHELTVSKKSLSDADIQIQMKSIKNAFDYSWNCSNKKQLAEAISSSGLSSRANTIKRTPLLCHSLIRVSLPRMRVIYMCNLVKAHYVLALSEVYKWLRMSSLKECREFLEKQNAVFTDDSMTAINCAESLPKLLQSSLLSKKIKAMG